MQSKDYILRAELMHALYHAEYVFSIFPEAALEKKIGNKKRSIETQNKLSIETQITNTV